MTNRSKIEQSGPDLFGVEPISLDAVRAETAAGSKLAAKPASEKLPNDRSFDAAASQGHAGGQLGDKETGGQNTPSPQHRDRRTSTKRPDMPAGTAREQDQAAIVQLNHRTMNPPVTEEQKVLIDYSGEGMAAALRAKAAVALRAAVRGNTSGESLALIRARGIGEIIPFAVPARPIFTVLSNVAETVEIDEHELHAVRLNDAAEQTTTQTQAGQDTA